MGYRKIPNLYKHKDLLLLKEVYALEKIHGTSANISFTRSKSPIDEITPITMKLFSGGIKHMAFMEMMDKKYDLQKIKNLFEKHTESYLDWCEIVIYGEAYGGSCQKMSHIYGDLNFVAFEVCIDDKWLDVPAAEKFALACGLPFVHYERGPATIEWLSAQRDKPSQQAIRNGMGDGLLGEGIIVRSIFEATLNNGERLIAKFKRDEFSERASGADIKVTSPEVLEKASDIAVEWVTNERCNHVIDALRARNIECDDKSHTSDFIKAMLDDVKTESAGEFEWTPGINKTIATRAAKMFHMRLCEEIKPTKQEQLIYLAKVQDEFERQGLEVAVCPEF